MAGLKIISCIVCEDARREANGGAILIGVNPIVICESGATKFIPRLCFYTELELSGECPSSFLLRGKSKKSSYVAFEVEVALNPEFVKEARETKLNVVSLQGFERLEIEETGEFVLQSQIENSRWQMVRTFMILEQPT